MGRKKVGEKEEEEDTKKKKALNIVCLASADSPFFPIFQAIQSKATCDNHYMVQCRNSSYNMSWYSLNREKNQSAQYPFRT